MPAIILTVSLGLGCDNKNPETNNLTASGTAKNVSTVQSALKTNNKTFYNLYKHKSAVISLSFSPKNDLLASGDINGNVNIWNVNTCKIEEFLPKRSKRLGCVQFSSDERVLAVGTPVINFWNLKTQTIPLSISIAQQPIVESYLLYDEKGYKRVIKKDESNVTVLDFSNVKKLMAVGSSSGMIEVWNIEKGMKIRSFKAHAKSISCLKFSKDGNMIVSGSLDKTLKVWESVSGKNVSSLTGRSQSTVAAAFSSDSKEINYICQDGKIDRWNFRTGLRSSMIVCDYLNQAAFSHNGRFAVVGSWEMKMSDRGNSTIYIIDVDSRKVESFNNAILMDSLAISESGDVVALGGTEGVNSVQLWKVTK